MIGKTLGHYRISEKIGEGGMGQVYKAHDEHLERDVAIKVLRSGSIPDDRTRKRFRKEAIALSKLNHPNIATVFDFDTQEEIDFIAMEYIPGQTLSEAESGAGISVEQVVEFGIQLAHGLGAAHGKGIIHRDLKPGNIRIMPDGRLKILDFGLAKFFQHPDGEVPKDSLSVMHGIAGTPSYMSPEQLCGDDIGPASDLFGAGIVLYEILTGKNPYEDVYSQSVSYNVIHSEPPPPSELRGGIPPSMDRIVMRLLEKRPEDRYASAAELESALKELKTGSDGEKAGSRRNRMVQRLALGFGAIAAVVLAILYFNMPVQIFSAESQHRTVKRLTFSGKADIPLWSPSGDNIVYYDQGIKLISSSGGAPRKLETGGIDLMAWSWTSDGKNVLTHGWDPERRDFVIVMLGLYGEEPQIILEKAFQPSMSSDGRMLLYTATKPPSEYGTIYLLDLESKEKRKIVEPSGEGTVAFKAFFSPDMSKIAYIRWEGVGHELWVINIDGSDDHKIQSDPIQLGGRYCWTEDGQGILIAGQLNSIWSIWRINLSGEGHTRMTAGSEEERHVTLAPDGERFVFGRQKDLSRLAILDMDDGTITRPIKLDVAVKHPAFSSDGRSILFQTLVNEQWQIWKAPADGNGSAVPVIAPEDLSSFGPVGADGRNIMYIRGKVAREKRWGKIEWTQTLWRSSCDGGLHDKIVEAGERVERIAPTPYRSGKLLYSVNVTQSFENIYYLDKDGNTNLLHKDSEGELVYCFDWGFLENAMIVARMDTSLQINQCKVVSSLDINTRKFTNLFTLDSLRIDGQVGIKGRIHAIALSPDRKKLAINVISWINSLGGSTILIYDSETSTATIKGRFEGDELPGYITWSPDGRSLALGFEHDKSDIFISEPSKQWSTAMK